MARAMRVAATGVSSIVVAAYMATAHGAEWTITPTIGVSESFTDNSTLAADGTDRNSDMISEISPGISLSGRGGRGTVNLNYRADQTFYHRDTQQDALNNNLAATGELEVWKRVAFIEGAASISQQIVSNTGPNSNSVSGQNVNRTETRAFTVSPVFRHHFGPWVETESRVSFSNVSTASGVVEDTSTMGERFLINSGRRFTQFTWSIDVNNSKTINDGDQPSERDRRVDGNFTYILNRNLSLLTGVGYEDVEDPGLNSQPSGLTWSVGFAAQPSPRTSFRFTVGERDGGTDYDFQGTHSLSPRTTVTTSYSESIQTSQRLVARDLSNAIFNPATGRGFDFSTGEFFTTDDLFGLGESTFRQKTGRIDITGSRRRNTFNGGLSWEQRETESTGITETVYGGNIGVSRRITPRATGNVNLSYFMTDSGTADNRSEDEIQGSAGLSYQVRNDIQATLTYNLSLTKVNNAPTDTLENSVTLGLTKSF